MIVNKCQFTRNLKLIENNQSSTLDKQFLLKQYHKQIRSQLPDAYCYLTKMSKDLPQHIFNSNLKSILDITDVSHVNTLATFILPDRDHIRGEFDIRYERTSLVNYFDFLRKEHVTDNDKTIKINWSEWVKAVESPNQQQLVNLIHRKVTLHLGKTFSYEGTIVLEDTLEGGNIEKEKEITSQYGLALLVPSIDRIRRGWKFISNIKTENKGSVPYQRLRIYLKLVADKHLIIEDGIALIAIELERPIHLYEPQGDNHATH